MSFRILLKMVFMTYFLAAPVLVLDAHAQQSKIDIVGFAKLGDTFLEAAYPMTPKEWNLYLKIQQYFDRVYAFGLTADPHFRRDATRYKVWSVKISKSANVMINLDPTFVPTIESEGDDPFFFSLRRHVENLLASGSGNRPTVIFVYGGKLRKLDTSGRLDQSRKKSAQRSRIESPSVDLVVINTGHGWTYYPDTKLWNWQRPVMDGLIPAAPDIDT